MWDLLSSLIEVQLMYCHSLLSKAMILVCSELHNCHHDHLFQTIFVTLPPVNTHSRAVTHAPSHPDSDHLRQCSQYSAGSPETLQVPLAGPQFLGTGGSVAHPSAFSLHMGVQRPTPHSFSINRSE